MRSAIRSGSGIAVDGFAIFLGVSSLVGGLVGWILLMKKKVTSGICNGPERRLKSTLCRSISGLCDRKTQKWKGGYSWQRLIRFTLKTRMSITTTINAPRATILKPEISGVAGVVKENVTIASD